MKTCDNTSVGILITDHQGRYLVFDRATLPHGTAPAAGHNDDHGSPEDAARAEVEEELGLTVTGLTRITGGWRENRCRRLPGARGTGHDWTVFHAAVTGELVPSARETKNVRWIDSDALQELTDRTVAHAQGRMSGAEFEAAPGIEPVWIQWLVDVAAIHISPDDLLRVEKLTR
ncbi:MULTISPECIES: NUDIX hydrolase [Streptomyces]|uniref:NUDIX hydrolase n=1 Tax=Streptomyces TaxID=1883 RepID=UPI002F90DA09